jgi:hypothetical protein
MNAIEKLLVWFVEFAAPNPVVLPYERDAESGHVELYVCGPYFCCVCVEIAPTKCEPNRPSGSDDRHDR